MSDQRIPISQLSETQTAPDASYIAIDDGSLTKKITVENFNSTSTASAQQYANQAAASAQTVENNIATSAAQIREATLAAREATQASTSATASATSAYDSASLAQNYSANASTSAGQAMNAADSAAQNLTASKGYAEDSEAWAVGKRNGSDVPASDETYQNNAKYYANSASGSATRAETAAQSINAPDTTLTVSGVAADSKAVGDRVSDLKSTFGDVLDVSSTIVTATTSGNNYVTYEIKAGKNYTFKVESGANCSIATVNASNQTIESVGTLMNGNSLVFTATQDAPKVLFYFRASGTGYVTSENAIDSLENQIAELKDDFIKAVGHISANVNAAGSGNNYVTYAIKAGETYNFTVSSTANCSIATVSEANQTIENVGNLVNGNLRFAATQDASKVLFYFRASGTGSVSTINELDGIIDLANSKYAKQWIGKMWANYGDSISWLFDWHSYVNNLLGFAGFIRNGKPGAPISWTDSTFGINENGIYTTGTPVKTVHESMCSYERISETLDNTLPLIFVMGGTNDFLGSVPLGDLTFNSADTTDGVWHTANAVGDYNISTFKGAMASMLMKLQYYAPNALIVFGTLLNGIGATSGVNQYMEQVNTANLKPSDYAKAEKEVCEVFGVPYVDVFANSGINITNRATYISDTVHPNVDGMKLLARCVASGLMTEFLRLT